MAVYHIEIRHFNSDVSSIAVTRDDSFILGKLAADTTLQSRQQKDRQT